MSSYIVNHIQNMTDTQSRAHLESIHSRGYLSISEESAGALHQHLALAGKLKSMELVISWGFHVPLTVLHDCAGSTLVGTLSTFRCALADVLRHRPQDVDPEIYSRAIHGFAWDEKCLSAFESGVPIDPPDGVNTEGKAWPLAHAADHRLVKQMLWLSEHGAKVSRVEPDGTNVLWRFCLGMGRGIRPPDQSPIPWLVSSGLDPLLPAPLRDAPEEGLLDSFQVLPLNDYSIAPTMAKKYTLEIASAMRDIDDYRYLPVLEASIPALRAACDDPDYYDRDAGPLLGAFTALVEAAHFRNDDFSLPSSSRRRRL